MRRAGVPRILKFALACVVCLLVITALVLLVRRL